ncbi:hypothetical protein B0H14DRAFT_2976727 [Mycena olivaceomarginata]|nr:hypothetical protein B0H14DRAFT_2976727 [Mycena olivaceomarginata]
MTPDEKPEPSTGSGTKPFHFGLVLNVLFGFASTFIVANFSLAVQFSESFGVDYNRVSRYATGILFISPLGDLVRRRQLILLLAIISGSLTIGLAITPIVVFEVLSYVIGFVSVTPQIMINGRGRPIRCNVRTSVRILVARVIAGILAQFTSWRVVYYFAIGVQYLVLVAGYFVIPDYPAKNKHMSYWGILRTMAKNFRVACGPLVGRLVDKLIPWYASLVAVIAATCFQAILGAGDVSVGAIIVVIMGLDVFRQMLQMSLATSLFIGQLMGTAAGTEVFTKYGWRPAAALNVGFYGWIFIIIMLRGPHRARYTWFGFEGGWEARKNVVDAKKKQAGESPQGELPTTEKMPVASPGSDEKVSTEGGESKDEK